MTIRYLTEEQVEKKFWSRVRKTSTCWLWTGQISAGYGHFYMNGRSTMAHIYSYRLHVGRVPLKRFVCHKCGIRNCVNPKHLEIRKRTNVYRSRSLKQRISPVDWCWEVLKRISRYKFLHQRKALKLARKLAIKHSKTPISTFKMLKEHLTQFDSLGLANGKLVFNQWEAVYQYDNNNPHCLFEIQKRLCQICNKPIFIANQTEQPRKICHNEWCERLYTFYYVEGRKRPPTVRGGKNNGLRFEYFLSDYIKRYSNEQTRTQHRRTP